MFKLPLRKLLFIVKLSFLFVLVLITLSLFEYWRGGKRATSAFVQDADEELFEKQILEDEARIIPGLGEGGKPAYLTGEEKRLGEEAEKKYAVNTYLSDRIAYNRTLKDFRNPACQRVTYDAELPSTSVIIIFHNEPYSLVIRTIWSVLNTARRDQPWHRQANYLERGSGRIMKLGYPGQPEDSEHVYLKEIILVDDNSTLPELRGKLARYVRTRLPPDMVRILRLPDRLGLTRARYAGAGAATGDVMVFLDAHCEGIADWMRPLLDRIKHSPKIGLTRARLAGARYANGEVLIFLDAHCEGVTDWMRPLLQRIKESPTAVVMPIIDVVENKDFFYSVQDPTQFQGLMRARVTGARAARGDVLVFLDAHCEAERDWLRPLLQRIRHKRDAVPTPVIDVIDQTTFHLDGEDPIQVGGFTFVGHFTWIDVPEREKQRRGSDIAPTWSPTMAGGLFAIRRAYYWELGAYDEQMAGWGGENLEMSFRIWQCGGTLETVPCSRVGHVFRSFHPYGLPANSDTHGINTARMAEVWMDDYAELFYLHRPDLRKNPKIGDVTHRKILREKLHCKSFQWFLDNVYREKYVPVRDSSGFGRVQNPATQLCLDTMQRDGEAAPLGFYPCHSKLTDTQYLSLSLAGQLRDEERCADVQFVRRAQAAADGAARRVVLVTCRDNSPKMQWRYVEATGQLVHAGSGLCLDARGAEAGSDAHARACESGGSPFQRWAIDYMGDESHSGLLPRELERALGGIRGQRRRSRSLLSVNEEGGAGGAGDTRRHYERRRHRSKKKTKKIHKNKFIVTIERTVRNNSVEHLEMDIHCKHKRLYPNNSFVRDLVSILNDKEIRVINNGRVFEKNKVTDLDKDRSLRQLEHKIRMMKPPEGETQDESTEANTEKFQPTSAVPAALSPRPAEPQDHEDDVPPPPHATDPSKPKKRHHKKKHSSSKYEKKQRTHEHSLLLSDKEYSGYHVAIGSGANGTGAQLPPENAPSARARETDDEMERDSIARPRSKYSRDHRRPTEDSYEYPVHHNSSELWLREDLATGDGRGGARNRTQGDMGGVSRLEWEQPWAEAIARNEVNQYKQAPGDRRAKGRRGKSRARAKDHRRRPTEDSYVYPVQHNSSELWLGEDGRGGARGGKGGETRSREDYREANYLRNEEMDLNAAEDYETRAAELPRGAPPDEDRYGTRKEPVARTEASPLRRPLGARAHSRRDKPRKQVKSEAQARAYKDRETAADRNHWRSDGDSSARHTADIDSSARHTADIDSSARHTADRDKSRIPVIDGERVERKKYHWQGGEDSQNSWDPWAPRGPGDAGPVLGIGDARKAAKDPHDVVEKLVYSDVWDREGGTPPPGEVKDHRVSALAKEVMMDYDELTETPPGTVLPRAKSMEVGAGTLSDGGAPAWTKALRVRLKSNMTVNLDDELLSWRRMQMTGQDSESGSPSDEAEPAIDSV